MGRYPISPRMTLGYPTSHLESIGSYLVHTNCNFMQLLEPVLLTIDLCIIIRLSTHDVCTSHVHLPNYVSIQH